MTSKLAQELDKFSIEQRRHIYENVSAIELTKGCSLRCDFCGFDAPKGVRSHTPFSDLERIAEEMSTLTDRITSVVNTYNYAIHPNKLPLYDATDPLDYEDEGKHYFDVKGLFASKGFKSTTSTAIPKGKEELAIEYLNQIERISISHMNRKRLEPYFERLGVVIYIDLFSYYRAKFGERQVHSKSPIREGQVMVKGSVDETIDRLREQDPTLPTNTRFYDLRKDRNKRHQRVQDLNTLVLWCGREEFPPRDGRIVDRDEDGLVNVGRAYDYSPYPVEHWQERREEESLCKISGIKLTPEGVFNVMPSARSQDCRTGRLTERITPEDFKIVKYEQVDRLLAFPSIMPWQYEELKAS